MVLHSILPGTWECNRRGANIYVCFSVWGFSDTRWVSILKSAGRGRWAMGSHLRIVFTQRTSQDELACQPPGLLAHFFPSLVPLYIKGTAPPGKVFSKVSAPNPNLLSCAKTKLHSSISWSNGPSTPLPQHLLGLQACLHTSLVGGFGLCLWKGSSYPYFGFLFT